MSLGYDDVMELGEIAEILIFPMEFCQHLFFCNSAEILGNKIGLSHQLEKLQLMFI